MPADILDRLRAADIVADRDEAPPFAETARRIAELRAAPKPKRRIRRVIPLALTATAALAASLAIVTGSDDNHRTTPFGVLQAAAATAGSSSADGIFSGYVKDTRIEIDAVEDVPAQTSLLRETIAPVSATEYEARMNGHEGHPATSERRPYGTLYTGPLPTGGHPAPAPTSAEEVREAIASWAEAKPPAGGDAGVAELLQDAYSRTDGTQLALGYAELVLTAPRVAPGVRAAVYDALRTVTGVEIDAHATDPAGRPAAALISESHHGPTGTRHELLIDPRTSRVLGSRDEFTVAVGANERRAANEPPYGTGSQQTTYRYDD
jgi:hypothetical protein